MKIFSKLSNVQSIAGISIRPGLNKIGAKKVESIKKHPRMAKHFSKGNLSEVIDQPKKKAQPQPKPKTPANPPKNNPKPEPAKEAPAAEAKE